MGTVYKEDWCKKKKSPYRSSIFNTEVNFQEVLHTPDNPSVEYFVDVDISYPWVLNEDHRDFPLAST